MKYIMNNFHIMKFILDFITGQCTTALIVYVIYKEMKIRKRQTANSTFTFAQVLCDGPDH